MRTIRPYQWVAALALASCTMIAIRLEAAELSETRLSPRVLILYHASWQETMTVVDAGPSLVVVDTWGSPAAARTARTRIEAVFHKPVSHVVNTHHHWDHTFGNSAFPQATIVGHRFCAEDMKTDYGDAASRTVQFTPSEKTAPSVAQYIRDVGAEASKPGFAIAAPTTLIEERGSLRVGDLTLLLLQTPGIHTRSNLSILIPELGIVFGRSEFSALPRLALEPGADPEKIAGVLEAMLSYRSPVQFLISGHGPPIESPDLAAAATWLRAIGARR